MTGYPARANASSVSRATDDGRLENTISHSSGGSIGWTTMSRTDAGILPGSFHEHASEYGFPTERSDAAIAVISNCGCPSRSCANLCPTVPVAPKIPTLYFFTFLLSLLHFQGFFHPPHTFDHLFLGIAERDPQKAFSFRAKCCAW